MAQLVYNIDQAIAVAGLLGDLSPKYVRSYKATVEIAFGLAVSLSGTSGDSAKIPTATDDVTATPLGVAVFSHDQVNTGAPGYPIDAAVNVLRKGTIWVKVEEAVNAEDPAFVRFATGTGTVLGSFRKSADTATAVALPGAKFLTSAAANGLALLSINI